MPYFLKDKYQFNHAYSFFLHNYLVAMLKEAESNRYHHIKIKFKSPEHEEMIESLSGEELYNFMLENGYEEEAKLWDSKQIFMASLSDFLHFVHTALTCSEKAKLTVTYALLRKPFKDNLLLLEFMISNLDDFRTRFYSENMHDELDVTKGISFEKKKEIIQAFKESSFFKFDNADFIFEVRYDKKCKHGLERLWQQANHIITSNKHIKTEPGNLNFVFMGDKEKDELWGYLYLILPTLLTHAVEVFLYLYLGIIKEEGEIEEWVFHNILLGFIYSAKLSELDYESGEFFEDVKDKELYCKQCQKKFMHTEDNHWKIINEGKYLCAEHHVTDIFYVEGMDE